MKKKALLLMLFIMFISTSAYSQNTIYGTVTGDVQEGVTVEIYNTNCGSNILAGSTTTNSEGYYSIGALVNGRYLVVPDVSGYPIKGYWVDIPQAPIKAYDFYITTKYSVVCDPGTSLCWQDPQREAYNYTDQGMRAFEADQYCEELILGGFEDWRVPTISEIRSITAGFPNTETGGSCPIVDGNITYAEAQFSLSCFNMDNSLTGNGPGDNGCYFKPGFTGTCDKYDPFGGHPLEHVAFERPLPEDDAWRGVLMFENGSVLFNHQCTLVDVRCVRDDDNSPVVDCLDNEPCDPGAIKSCDCIGFPDNGTRPDGIQTCNDAGNCWGPCECTKSVIDTSVDSECHAGNDLYDQADILTVKISLPEGDTISYDPIDLQAFLYRCPDNTTEMPSSPPDGGSWENLITNPGQPPYSMEVRGISYYRESLIADGRYCLLVMLNQLHRMPPIPINGDYYKWDANQGIVFPLDGGAQTVDVILDKVGN